MGFGYSGRRYVVRTPTASVVAVALAFVFAAAAQATTPTGRYTIASGVVTDTKTRLKWEQIDGATYSAPSGDLRCVK
jgi:hypothetical protein